MEMQIFISYSWKDKKIVDEVDKDFMALGITLVRDIRDTEFKDSLRQFMKRIRTFDFAIVIVSDSFLKSKNCLIEILEFIKDDN